MNWKKLVIASVVIGGVAMACRSHKNWEETRGDNEEGSLVFEGDQIKKAFNESNIITSPYEFKKVAAMWDATEHADIEVAVSNDKRNWSDFKALNLVFEEAAGNTVHVGSYDVSQDTAKYLKIRAKTQLPSFLKLEFVENASIAVEESASEKESAALSLVADIPGLIKRASWGAKEAKCSYGDHKADRFTIHHAETPNDDKVAPDARVRAIQAFHQDTRGWCDVGYHYLISRDGKIFEGTPVAKVASHTAKQNSRNIGICYLGSYDTLKINDAQIKAGASILKAIAKEHTIKLSRDTVKGHRERMAPGYTQCPGDELVAQLGDLVAAANETVSTAPVPAPGPKTVVKGLVYEGTDKSKVIAGAEVTLGAAKATTDAKGYFEFKDIPAGSITVKVSKAGFKDASVTRASQIPDTWASVSLTK